MRRYGIARLLRLSIGNLHIKIPFEDLPSCRRLVTLCQVRFELKTLQCAYSVSV